MYSYILKYVYCSFIDMIFEGGNGKKLPVNILLLLAIVMVFLLVTEQCIDFSNRS